MSDARTTLEVVLKATGFTEGGAAIKKLGDEATTAQGKLKQTTSEVDKVSKSTASLGGKLKNAGSQFAGTITSVAALGSSVVNLSRQYQDLGDTQIAVEKAQRRVSTANEAVIKAQNALNSATSKYGKNSAQAKQATLDLGQAQAQLSINTQLLTERTEDHQRAQENFWMGLVPTILTAGTGVTSMLKEMGGTSGLGGLTTKLKGLPSSLGMSTKAFAGMAGAIGLASVALVELLSQMERGAKIKSLQILNEGPGRTSSSIAAEIEELKKQKASWGQQAKDFFFSGPLGKGIAGDSGAHIIDEVVKSLESKDSRDKLIAGLQKTLENVMNTPMDPKTKTAVIAQIKTVMAMYANDKNWSAGYGATAEAVSKNTQKVIADGLQKGIDALAKAPPLGLTGALKTMYDKVLGYPGTTLTGETAKFAVNPTLLGIPDDSTMNKLYADFKAKRDQAYKDLTKVNQENLDFFAGSWEGGITTLNDEWEGFGAASQEAADKIKADQVAAAAEVKQAWLTALGEQESGIQKVIDAYNKLHPKEKGFSGLGQEKQFTDAQAQMEKLMSGVATKLGSPAYAQKFVTDFVTNAAKKMTPIAGQVFQPIMDYINENKGVEATTWMSGFLRVLGTSSPTLAKTFSDMFYNSATKPAEETGIAVAGAISTGLAKIDVTPLEEKMKLGAEAAGLVTKGINKIPKKVTSTVNITANLAQANAKWAAFVRKVQMTTLQVKIAGTSVNIRKGSQAGAYGGPGKQHGWNTTVKRPTSFIAGEGGRPEDVYIKPKGSAGQRPGGDGFSGTINVFVDGVQRPARYSMGARK